MRLNGWQRIGIILSVIWAGGAAYYETEAITARERAAMVRRITPPYEFCREEQDYAIRTSQPFNRDCVEENRVTVEKVVGELLGSESRWTIALAALAPIPLAWLLIYALLGVWRWVRRGFAA